MTSQTLPLFVPAANSNLDSIILPGSAIVGSPCGDPTYWKIDYEGNKFHTEQFEHYGNRCLHAAGRHLTNYPTVARLTVLRTKLVQIGTFETEFAEVALDEVGGYDLLTIWLGHTPKPDDLASTGGIAESLRVVRDLWTPAQRQQLFQLPASQRRPYQEAGLI